MGAATSLQRVTKAVVWASAARMGSANDGATGPGWRRSHHMRRRSPGRWTGREFADPTGRLMNNPVWLFNAKAQFAGVEPLLALAEAHFGTIRMHPRKQRDLVQRQLGADYAQLVNRSSNIAHVL